MVHHCVEHVEKESEAAKENEEKKDEKDDNEEKKDETKPDDTFQAFAVLGVAMIAMGEDIGAEMSIRQFNHIVSTLFSWTRHRSTILTFCRCTTVTRSFEKPFLWH